MKKWLGTLFKGLEPINEGLYELNRNLEVEEEKRLTPQRGSKHGLVAADYGPLAEAFIRNYVDNTVEKMFDICFKNGKFLGSPKRI